MKKIILGIAIIFMAIVGAFSTAFAAAPWHVTGNYEITFRLDSDPTPFTHHATLTQSGSTVTGDGGYPSTGGDTYHWNVTSGLQTASGLNLTVLYDLGAVGTTMNMVGVIAADGTVTGTWTDDFGGARTGTWSITKGVSVPLIHTPANNAVVTQSAFVKVDWTDSIGSNPPFQYMYEAYSDSAYTSLIYSSGWSLAASEIPSLGTPPGDYYIRVRAQNTAADISDWSNGAGNPYKITVTADITPTPTPINPFPVPAECDQNISYNLIQGTNGSDVLNGTSGPDLILAKGGSDVVNGLGGNDCIVGGNGSDSLMGNSGNDVILGGADSDSIQGNNGMDKLYGEEGSDSLSGGADADQIWGGAGSDSLSGGAGNDMLDGQLGIDFANGGLNTDTCIAEAKALCEL